MGHHEKRSDRTGRSYRVVAALAKEPSMVSQTGISHCVSCAARVPERVQDLSMKSPWTCALLQASRAALDSSWLHEFEAGQALENQGATCYINSTVQCIVHNPFLANLALGGQLQLCQCRRCVLCYLNYRIKSSFRAVAEAHKGYPAWMVHTGIKQLGTHSHDRLSATRQVKHRDLVLHHPVALCLLTAQSKVM